MTYDQTEVPDASLAEALTALDIDPKTMRAALAADLEYAEFLLATAIYDLYIAGSLHTGQEVVRIAQRYWPISLDQHDNNAKKEN